MKIKRKNWTKGEIFKCIFTFGLYALFALHKYKKGVGNKENLETIKKIRESWNEVEEDRFEEVKKVWEGYRNFLENFDIPEISGVEEVYEELENRNLILKRYREEIGEFEDVKEIWDSHKRFAQEYDLEGVEVYEEVEYWYQQLERYRNDVCEEEEIEVVKDIKGTGRNWIDVQIKYKEFQARLGEMDGFVQLRNTHGGTETIEKKLREFQEITGQFGDKENIGRKIENLEKEIKELQKFEQFRDQWKELEDKNKQLIQEKTKNEEQLLKLDRIGGDEVLEKVREIQNKFGNLENIREKLERLEQVERNLYEYENLKKEWTKLESKVQMLEEDKNEGEIKMQKLEKLGGDDVLDEITKLQNKFGNLENIKNKLQELDYVQKNLLEYENLKKEKTLIETKNRDLERERDEFEIKLQKIEKLGGEDRLKEIEILQGQFGNIDNIKKKLNELEKLAVYERIKEENDKLKVKNEEMEQKIKNLEAYKYVIGQEDDLQKVKDFRKYGDWDVIESKLETFEETKQKAARLEQLEKLCDDNNEILEKFKQELERRKEEVLFGDSAPGTKIGKIFEKECEDKFLATLGYENSDDKHTWTRQTKEKEGGRTWDAMAKFATNDEKLFEVDFEFKAIEEYHKLVPIKNICTNIDKENIKEKIEKQIKYAIDQSKKNKTAANYGGLKFIVLSIDSGLMKDLNINSQQHLKEHNTMIIPQDILEYVLISLKAIANKFSPIAGVESFSNPEYLQMLIEFGNAERWDDFHNIGRKFMNNLTKVESNSKNAKKHFEKIIEFFKESQDIAEKHIYKATKISRKPELIKIEETMEKGFDEEDIIEPEVEE